MIFQCSIGKTRRTWFICDIDPCFRRHPPNLHQRGMRLSTMASVCSTSQFPIWFRLQPCDAGGRRVVVQLNAHASITLTCRHRGIYRSHDRFFHRGHLWQRVAKCQLELRSAGTGFGRIRSAHPGRPASNRIILRKEKSSRKTPVCALRAGEARSNQPTGCPLLRFGSPFRFLRQAGGP